MKPMMWNGVGIAVVGDKDTGIPSLSPYLGLPSDALRLEEDTEKILELVKRADVVILTFAFDRPETLDRLSDHWLPLFRQSEVRVPIIVAGYTVDGKGVCDQNSIEFEKMTSPMMQQYPEVETSIQWSSQRPNEAKQVIYNAHKAAIHPVGPVFNRETKLLNPRCVAALKRIFILSGHDKDGILSGAELNKFQEKCFNNLSTPLDIKQLNKAMQVMFPQGVNKKGLTLDGFLFLNKRFIEEGRIETLWTILDKFEYNKSLRLPCRWYCRSIEAGESYELSDKAIKFLRKVYEISDKDSDNNLKPHELESLFGTAPESPWNEAPYKDASEETKDGGLSLEAFLSLWSLMTLIDPERSAEYLTCIMFPDDLSSAIHKIHNRFHERNVVQCFVFGPKNAGKSALLNQFIGRSYDDDSNNNNKSTDERYAVNMLKESEGFWNTAKILVLKEIRIQEDGFTLSNEALAACDVAVFIYDSSDESSWNRAIDLLAEVATAAKDAGYVFPCLMVAAKTDLDSFPMAIQESTRVTQEIGLDAPVPISSKLGDFNDLFRKILTAAGLPNLNIPEIKSKKEKVASESKKI